MPRFDIPGSIARIALTAAIGASLTGAALWPASADARRPAPSSPPVAGGAMHVGDLDGVATSKSAWQAKITITVHDASDRPVAGVSVGAAWGGGAAGTARCKTGRNGTCSVTSPTVPAGTTQVTLTMLGASAPGFTYDATANHDADGSSDGTTIVVSK